MFNRNFRSARRGAAGAPVKHDGGAYETSDVLHIVGELFFRAEVSEEIQSAERLERLTALRTAFGGV